MEALPTSYLVETYPAKANSSVCSGHVGKIKAKAQRRPVRRLNNANLTGSSLVDALNKGLATYTGANLSGLDLDRRFFYLGCYRTLQN